MEDFTQHPPLEDPVRVRVLQELEAGEVLVWVQQACPRFWTRTAYILVPMGIVWVAFVGGAILLGTVGKTPDFSWSFFFSLCFMLVNMSCGFLVLYSPFWSYQRMKRTIYAVTNRRALIIASTTTSFDADDLSLITRRDHLDQRSDLLFNAGRLGDEEFGFLNITNPREVEGHLHRVETSPVN